MTRPLLPLVSLLAGCLAAPADPESVPAAESAPPAILRFHGAVSDGIEPWASSWVTARGEDCPLTERPEDPRVYDGPASLAGDGTNDVVSRALRDGAGGYVLDVPLRWKTERCSYEATSIAVHLRAADRPEGQLGGATLRIVSHRMPESTDVATIGTLSCRRDAFALEGLACRRASGPFAPGSDPATGLTFFSHVVEPVPPAPLVDVPLDLLERRAFCQQDACEAGCAAGEAGCLPSDCDPARDCSAELSTFRQEQPVAIAAHGALVSRSELVVEGEGARPARLADLVIDLDYFAPDDIVIRATHEGTTTTVLGPGASPAPRFGSAGRGVYAIPLDARTAASPAGTWTLEVEQRRPFFTGAVLSWGLDLYR